MSPVAVKGNERVVISHLVCFLNDSLSPHLLHDISKYTRIAPKSESSPTVTHKSCNKKRNLVTTFSDVQVAENELKISLQSQFQLAVEEIFQNIRKQQITSMKKRIQSFMIKI